MVMQNALAARMRTVREGDLMRLALPVLLLPAVLAAGCAGGDDQNDTLPSIDGGPTSSGSTDNGSTDNSNSGGDDNKPSDDPSYSPAPKGAKLTDDERAAYKAAVKDYEAWSDVASKLQRNPQTDKRTHSLVRRLTFSPYARAFYDRVAELERDGVRILGKAETHWRVPTKVKLAGPRPTITWRECIGDGSMRAVKSGNRIKQKDTRPFVSLTTMTADNNGLWRPHRTRNTGLCDAP